MRKVKLVTILMIIALIITLSACKGTKPKEEAGVKTNSKTYKIGILQLVEHPSLDAAREGFEDTLKESGLNIEIDYKNAQGDIMVSNTMAQAFVGDKVDLIYAIATPAAQSAKQAAVDIPVLFSAVTDPVEAGLVKSMEDVGGNVTGTTDMTPIKQQLSLFKEISDDIKTVGIVYNTSEVNSQIQVDIATEAAKELDLEIKAVGINNVNEMAQALESLMEKTDGMYNITDNLVASSLSLISQKALEKNKVVVQAFLDESEQAKGILLSNGFTYYDLGKQTADMAIDILKGEKTPAEIPVGIVEETQSIVSRTALEKLGIDENLDVIKNSKKVN